jgi:hypothetical protein
MEQHNATLNRIAEALERIAAALEHRESDAPAVATTSPPPRFPLNKLSEFTLDDWARLDLTPMAWDKDNIPTQLISISNSRVYDRRQSNNDVWFSRYIGKDEDGERLYEKAVVFSGQASTIHRLPPDLIQSLPPRAKAAAQAKPKPKPSPQALALDPSQGFASIDEALAELDAEEEKGEAEAPAQADADTDLRQTYYTLTGDFISWLNNHEDNLDEETRETAIYNMNRITGQVGAIGWPKALNQLRTLTQEIQAQA